MPQYAPAPALTDDQLLTLAKYLHHKKRFLELALVTIACSGALRTKDLAELRIEAIERTEHGLIANTAALETTSTSDKSAKVLCAFRNDELDPTNAFDIQAGGRTSGPLFPYSEDQPDQPMSAYSLRKRFKRQAANAGIKQDVTLKSLRQAWSTHAYENGLDALTMTRHLRQGQSRSTLAYISKLSAWVVNPAVEIVNQLQREITEGTQEHNE